MITVREFAANNPLGMPPSMINPDFGEVPVDIDNRSITVDPYYGGPTEYKRPQ